MLVVVAGVIYKNGQILISQRPPGKHGAFQWEFPGGKIEKEEDPRSCLVREVWEELGIRIQAGKILETVFHRYPDRSVLLLFYECTWLEGEPRPIQCHSLAWVDPQSLTSYDFLEADLDFIQRIQKGQV